MTLLDLLGADLYALHLGAMHTYEKALTLVLAFGPFVVLGLVIWLRRGDEDEAPDSLIEPVEITGEEQP